MAYPKVKLLDSSGQALSYYFFSIAVIKDQGKSCSMSFSKAAARDKQKDFDLDISARALNTKLELAYHRNQDLDLRPYCSNAPKR